MPPFRRMERLSSHLGSGTTPVQQEAAAAAAAPKAVRVGDSGRVYRGSEAEPDKIYSGFPSLVRFDDQHLGCAFTMGPASDSVSSHAVFARSRDGGETWLVEGPIRSASGEHADLHPTNDFRISLASDGRVLAFGALLYKHPDDDTPLNTVKHAGGGRAKMGYTNMAHLMYISSDQGRSWGPPIAITDPVVGPSWELCMPIVESSDGRWFAPGIHAVLDLASTICSII